MKTTFNTMYLYDIWAYGNVSATKGGIDNDVKVYMVP